MWPLPAHFLHLLKSLVIANYHIEIEEGSQGNSNESLAPQQIPGELWEEIAQRRTEIWRQRERERCSNLFRCPSKVAGRGGGLLGCHRLVAGVRAEPILMVEVLGSSCAPGSAFILVSQHPPLSVSLSQCSGWGRLLLLLILEFWL